MASTWSELGIRLMATGENANAWGGQTNDNWNRLEDAADGFATVAVSGATSLTFTAQPTSYADENGRNKVLVFTGTAGGTQAITFPNIEKTYHVLNDSNSTLTLTTGTGAATVSLAAGKDMMIYNDGSDEIHNALANIAATTVTASGIIKTDDTTNATSTTDGSLQTDGGLSVVLDAVFGDDIKMLSDASEIAWGANGEILLTHEHDRGLKISHNGGGDPDLILNNTASASDGNQLGSLFFNGLNSNGDEHTYAFMLGQARDVTDGEEDGQLVFFGAKGGADKQFISYGGNADGASPTHEVCINDGSEDINFRVESNGNANMIFVDGGNDHVNIGTATDHGGVLNVESTDNAITLLLASTDTDANAGPQLKLLRAVTGADNDICGQIEFGAKDDAGNGEAYAIISQKILTAANGSEEGRLTFKNMEGGSQRDTLSLDASEVVINEDSRDIDFRVESNGKTHMIFVDAGNDHVCIGTSTDHGGMLNVDGPILMSESDSLLLRITSSSSDVKFQNRVANKDISFEGIDGSSDITALHLDMADAGFATFNGNAKFGGKINVGGTTTTKGAVVNRNSPINNEVFAAAGGMHSIDDRDPKPGNFPTGQYSNFSSYAGTGQSTPYADVMILDTFGHSSGGNANAIFISKADPNDIKIAQQTTQSTSTFAAGTQVNIDTTSISDASVKENVQTITDCLSKVAQLRPVTFEWTDEYINNGMSRNASEKTFTGGELATFYTEDDELPEDKEVGDVKTEGSAPTRVIPTTKTTNVGLIAQEVEAVIPTVVHQNRVSLAGSEDYQKNVDYDKLVPHLIGAIKELKDRIEALEG